MRSTALALLLLLTPAGVLLAQAPLPSGHPPVDGTMPAPAIHRGSVLETIEAAPYVYIHVKEDSGEQWLAAPAMTLAKGAVISWPDGLVMTNFHSKTLNRTFDQVVFVNTVTPGK